MFEILNNIQYLVLLVPIGLSIYYLNQYFSSISSTSSTSSKRNNPNLDIIIPLYTPPSNLTPAEVGIINDRIIGNQDISATFIDLVNKGYMKINFQDQDILFTNNNLDTSKLNNFEKRLMFNIFKLGDQTSLSKLKGDTQFTISLQEIYGDLLNWSKSSNLFIISPLTEGIFKNSFSLLLSQLSSGFFIEAVFPFYPILNNFKSFFVLYSIFAILVIISFIIHLYVLKNINFFTPIGLQIKNQIEGLKLFIDVAQKDKMKIINDPSINPQVFMNLLPYAISLHLLKEWQIAFGSLYSNLNISVFNLDNMPIQNSLSFIGSTSSQINISFVGLLDTNKL